jgi:hypothetical protein
LLSRSLTTIIAAAISAYACGAVAQFGTPIDAALPVIAVIITIVAAMTRPAIQLAVPLLMGGEIVIADERLRLIWFGVVIGIAFAAALLFELDFIRAAVLTVGAIILLRWIPLSSVMFARELLLIAIALLIVFVMRSAPVGVVVAISVALFTPAIPLRTLGFPIAVLIVLTAFRAFGMPRLRADVLCSFAVAVMLLFFAWSGIFARALPLAIRGLPIATPRAPMNMALAPGQSITLDVPSHATALILSGANLSRLREGTIVGSVNRVPVRIGEIADWGFLRREYFYGSRNTVPVNAAGAVRGYGQSAWVDGAARFPIPQNATTLRVTADRRLPSAARLQINSFELEK